MNRTSSPFHRCARITNLTQELPSSHFPFPLTNSIIQITRQDSQRLGYTHGSYMQEHWYSIEKYIALLFLQTKCLGHLFLFLILRLWITMKSLSTGNHLDIVTVGPRAESSHDNVKGHFVAIIQSLKLIIKTGGRGGTGGKAHISNDTETVVFFILFFTMQSKHKSRCTGAPFT